MTALVRAALRARWRFALTVLLLAAAAAMAAAAPLLYRPAAVRAATAGEVAAAPPAERRITAERHLEPVRPSINMPENMFPPETAEDFPAVTGFDTIGSLLITGLIVDPADLPPAPDKPLTGLAAPVLWRAGACAHVTLAAGRCATGLNEVLISTQTAERRALTLGATVSLHVGKDYYPTARYTVVGLYTPNDPNEEYWGGHTYFAGWSAREPVADPLFATHETVRLTLAPDYLEVVELHGRPEAFPRSARTAPEVVGRWAPSTEWSIGTGLPALDRRIVDGGNQLRNGLTLAGLPLVLLAWFVLWFAVSYGVGLRRSEAGLFALRGTPPSLRWAMVAAEAGLPVLAGAPLGYLAAWLVVWLLSLTTLTGAPPVLPTTLSIYATAAAVGGALLIGLLAQVRTVTAPVSTLLRSTPPRRRPVVAGTAEAVAGALAAAAAYQVGTAEQTSGGLELLVPMLIALTAGLLGARLAGLLAGRLAGRALRRGRLVRGLAAAEFARQPAQLRVVTLTVIVFSLVGFAAAAAVTAAEGRGARARSDVGAPRVLSVAALGEQDLLRVVRTADPEGRWAMAAARVNRAELTALAVDSERLATVADWDPRYGEDAATVASLLRPVPATPLRIGGESLTVRATAVAPPRGSRLWVTLLPISGPIVRVLAGDLTEGERDYTAALNASCATGCRIGALEVETGFAAQYEVDLTVSGIAGGSGPIDAGLTDPARWRTPAASVLATPQLTVGPAGARLAYRGNGRPDLRLLPVATPIPLPVVTGGHPANRLPSATGLTPIVRAGHIESGPGGALTLVDLEYLDLTAYDAAVATDPQVWLRAGTPESVIAALTANGLVITGERSIDRRRETLAGQGPALALRFHLLSAAGAVLLGAGGLAVLGADRSRRVRQLRALRAQGLRAGPAWRSQLAAQLAVVGAGAVLGLFAGTLSWWLGRGAITYYVDDWALLPPPSWPGPVALLGPLAALVVLSLVATVTAASLRRAVEDR